REGARRSVPGEVAAEPALLRRAFLAPADLRAVRVQGDQVPRADVEAVVAPSRRPGGLPEVASVAGGLRRPVLVVARCGLRYRFHATPGGRVGQEVLAVRAVLVLVVAESENGRVPAL